MNANRAHLPDLGVFALIASALTLNPLGHVARERGDFAEKAAPAVDAPPRRGFFERLDNWFWRNEQRATEAYLAKATDVYDLEARIRDLERGVLYRYY